VKDSEHVKRMVAVSREKESALKKTPRLGLPDIKEGRGFPGKGKAS